MNVFSDDMRGFAGAAMLESAILDLQPDSAIDMNRKKKMMRWDAKKRKFVKVTPLPSLSSFFAFLYLFFSLLSLFHTFSHLMRTIFSSLYLSANT